MSVGFLKKCSTSKGTPKKAYPSQDRAEKFRSWMISQGIWKPGNSNTYFCNQCGGYHAGSIGSGNRGKGRTVSAKNRPRHLASQ